VGVKKLLVERECTAYANVIALKTTELLLNIVKKKVRYPKNPKIPLVTITVRTLLSNPYVLLFNDVLCM